MGVSVLALGITSKINVAIHLKIKSKIRFLLSRKDYSMIPLSTQNDFIKDTYHTLKTLES